MEQNKDDKKLSYEQLAQICGQQQQQIKKMAQQLQEQNYQNVMGRLSVLMEVVKTKAFDDTPFQRECMDEIEQIVRIKKDDNSDGEGNKG